MKIVHIFHGVGGLIFEFRVTNGAGCLQKRIGFRILKLNFISMRIVTLLI